MTKYARIENGVVVEFLAPVEGFTIDQCFTPELVKELVECPDEVQVGWICENGVFTAPAPLSGPSPEELAARIRTERDARLAATDYLMMPDYPLLQPDLATLEDYRAALRNITDLDGFPWDGPETAPWPVKPKL